MTFVSFFAENADLATETMGGSLHSDIWRGPANDLARRGVIAVYPVGGWWKERVQHERYNSTARFSLVVTIETPTVDLDIYSEISNRIVIPIEIPEA